MHAIRNLARVAFGTASVRSSQLGFGRTSSTSTTQDTPRNLFGFKDGTNNIKAEETDVVDQNVWVAWWTRAEPWRRTGPYCPSPSDRDSSAGGSLARPSRGKRATRAG